MFLPAEVMSLRRHAGQKGVADVLRALLHSETFPSEIAGRHQQKFIIDDTYCFYALIYMKTIGDETGNIIVILI